MPLPEHAEEQIVVGMYDRGLIGFPGGGMQLKSGRRLPYYYTSRQILSVNRELERTGQMSIKRQHAFRQAFIGAYVAKFLDIAAPFDHVLGKAQAVTASAGVGAYAAGLSYLWERIDEPSKKYGQHQRIEGDYVPGERVLIADNVITDGKSKIEGLTTLRHVGLIPVAATLEFDREEGGVQTLEELGLEVNAVTTLSRATRYLLYNGRIDGQAIDALQTYHAGLRAEGVVSTFEFAS